MSKLMIAATIIYLYMHHPMVGDGGGGGQSLRPKESLWSTFAQGLFAIVKAGPTVKRGCSRFIPVGKLSVYG